MASSRKTASNTAPASRFRQVLVVAGVLAALVFAVQGGEYGTRDLMRQKTRRQQLSATNDSLQHVIDSLKQYRRRLLTDARLQERIAREEFGLVRGDHEILYRFVEGGPSTTVIVP